MCEWTDKHFYAVTTRHGSYESFHSLEQARASCVEIMKGYLEGLTCANDPKPTIIKIEEVESLGFNNATKTVFKKSGGEFGGYSEFDCYKDNTL